MLKYERTINHDSLLNIYEIILMPSLVKASGNSKDECAGGLMATGVKNQIGISKPCAYFNRYGSGIFMSL